MSNIFVLISSQSDKKHDINMYNKNSEDLFKLRLCICFSFERKCNRDVLLKYVMKLNEKIRFEVPLVHKVLGLILQS